MRDQLFIGEKPQKEKMNSVTDREAFVKPYGGLWTSDFDPSYGSDWLRWCHDSDWYGDDVNAWLLVPESDLNLFVVDSYEDLTELVQEYTEPIPKLEMIRNYLFGKMAEDFDGVHLTQRGFNETHMSYPHSLYGWDCQSTIWFRWKFQEVKKVEIIHSERGYYHAGV